MKRLLPLLFLLIAAPSWAQSIPPKVWTNLLSDTVSTLTSVNFAGKAAAERQPGVPKWTAESTAVIDVSDYDYLTLLLKVDPPAGDTTNAIGIGVQIRAHTDLTGDSSSTFAWYETNLLSPSVNTPDSLFNNYGGGAPTGAPNNQDEIAESLRSWLWPGEFEVSFAPMGLGKTNQYFGGLGKWLAIPLDRRNNTASVYDQFRFNAPYMSVRVRCIYGPTAFTVANCSMTGLSPILTTATADGFRPVVVGQVVTGSTLPAGTTVVSLIDATHVTLSYTPPADISAFTASFSAKKPRITVGLMGVASEDEEEP